MSPKPNWTAPYALPDGKLRTKTVPNNPQGYNELLGWLSYKQALDIHVCMEATGVYLGRGGPVPGHPRPDCQRS